MADIRKAAQSRGDLPGQHVGSLVALLQRGRNGPERGVQVRAERLHDGDDSDGNARRDQTVFNSSCSSED
jgi:hypothetical protein